MIWTDDKGGRVRVIPVTALLLGIVVAAAFVFRATGLVHFHIFKTGKWDLLFLAGAALVLAVACAYHWRTLVRRGDAIHISSILKKWRFTASRVNVFVEREVQYQRNRKRIVYEVGFEDGIERLVMHTAQSSPAANRFAQKLRNALGLGLNDTWMR